MAKKKEALQRILGDSGDDYDIAIGMLTQRRFPVKLEGRFALPPMRPFKDDDGNWTAATADNLAHGRALLEQSFSGVR